MDNLELLKPSLQKRQKRRDKRLGEELIECSRYCFQQKQKGSYKNKVRRADYAEAKKHESMKFMYNGGTKYFNDNLEPLMRFLHTHRGKNWNKVFGELNAKLDKRTVPGLHVFNHLWGFVVLNIRMEKGTVYHLRLGHWEELVSWEKWPKFYVHPKTGQLCKARMYNQK